MATTPRSYQQILGGMISRFTARLGISRLKPGSALLTQLEAAAQSDARASQDIFKISQVDDLDNQEGQGLDRIGIKEGILRFSKKKAISLVTITDPTFQKVSSTIYQGRGAPIVGSVSLYVAKGSTFDLAAATGNIYLGRGTANYEGPLAYASKTDSGSHWTLALSSPTTKFHNGGESVILAQGGSRQISSGQIVSTAQGAMTAPKTYTVTQSSNLPDGETEVAGIAILATNDGENFNVPKGSIVSFSGSPPFTGATVTNPSPVTSGRNTEGDNAYRDRIRQGRNSRQRGIDVAIKNAIVNLSSPEENSSILSSSLVKKQNSPSVLYIDDGNGYEPKFRGVGHETLIDPANGGETMFQTVYSPLHQGCVESTQAAPYVIVDGASLTVKVGGIPYTHNFDTYSFTVPTAASAYDIVSSINSNYTLGFIAKVTGGGTKVTLFSKTEVGDTLEVVSDGTDANGVLGFPVSVISSVSLYKNDALLSKDGEFAQVRTLPYASWGYNVLPDNDEYIAVGFVKGTDTTFTFTRSDFSAVGHNVNTPPSLEVWKDAINAKIVQVTAQIEGDTLVLTSKAGRASSAYLSISSGTLVTLGMFLSQESQGKDSEYSVDRAVGAIVLTTPLASGDRLTLGTNWSEAFVQSSALANYDTVSSLTDFSYWFLVDDTLSKDIAKSYMVNITSAASVPLTSVSTPTLATLERAGCFPSCVKQQIQGLTTTGISKGDWVLFSDPAFNTITNGDWYQKATRTNLEDGILIEKKSGGTCRIGHTASVVTISGVSNLVLVTGGLTSTEPGIGLPGALKGKCATNSVEIYNPANGTWVFTAPMMSYRSYHTATVLPNGNVFVCGGFNQIGVPLSTTEIFDVTTQTWSAGYVMPQARVHHTATLIPSGNVLIVGGCSSTAIGASAVTTSVEYNPGTNTFIRTATVNTVRYGHQAILVGSDVLVFGGISTVTTTAVPIDSVEMYMTGPSTWVTRASMTEPRAFFGAALTGTSVIVVGNTRRFNLNNVAYSSISPFTNVHQNTYQVYDSTGDAWGAIKTINNVGSFGATGLAIWNQGDLVRSTTSGRIIAGYAGVRTDVDSDNKTSHLAYDAVGDAWSPIAQTAYELGNNLSGREGHVGVAFNSGALNDTVAWIGGAVVSSTVYGANQTYDLLSYKDAEYLAVVPVETFDATTETFNVPAVNFTDLVLDEGRIPVVHSFSPPQKVTIPSNSSKEYTASTYTEEINGNFKDVIAETHQTNSVRISTLSDDGSLMVVDRDEDTLPLAPNGVNTPSQPSQYAIVKAGNSGVSIPADMQIWSMTAVNETSSQVLSLAPNISKFSHYQASVDVAGTIVGMTHYPTGRVGSALGITPLDNLGGAKFQTSPIKSIYMHGSFLNPELYPEENSIPTNYGIEIETRNNLDVIPRNPIYIGQSYKFTPTDTLVATIDQNVDTHRYVIPMARKMVPATATYQSPLSLKDADNGNTTISTAFGLDYNFDDFAIISRAKAITDSGDATKRIVWRYSRYGEEGNWSCIRYTYPTEPNQPIKATQNSIQSPEIGDGSYYYKGVVQNTIDVVLSSGSRRDNVDMSPNTRIHGVRTASSPDATVWDCYFISGYKVLEAERATTNGITRLRLELPGSDVPDAGIAAGAVLWFEAVAPASTTLQSGQFKVNSLGAFVPGAYRDIYISPLILNDGTIMSTTANPGTVSFDSTQEAKFDSAVTANDIIVFGSDNAFPGTTPNRIVSVGVSRQFVKCRHKNIDPSLTMDLVEPTFIARIGEDKMDIFGGSSSTAAQIAAAINAQENSPVSAVSSGSGVINVASWDQNSSITSRTALTDGINYVKTTNIPANVGVDTTFDMKLSVTSALGVNGDYSNEVFYIAPVSPKTVVQWLNTPAVTGLWTAATVSTCDRGTGIQIKTKTPGVTGSVLIEGGRGNLATASIRGEVNRSNYNVTAPLLNGTGVLAITTSGLVVTTTAGEAQGFTGGCMVEISNSQNTEKVNNNSPGWGDQNNIIRITKAGMFVFSEDIGGGELPLENRLDSTIVRVERLGKYVAINVPTEAHSCRSDTIPSASMSNSYYTKSGYYISMTPGSINPISPSNQGVFRILYTSCNESYQTFWIENEYAIDEIKECLMRLMPSGTVVPGDSIIIDTSDFGEQNRGEWKVISVTDNYVMVDISSKRPVDWSGSAGTRTELITVISGTPAKTIKKLVNIAPNNNNPDWADMLLLDEVSVLDYANPSYMVPWSESAGTVVKSLGKLEFPQGVAVGSDAYKYNYGLIAEAKRVIYGDAADSSNYSGYAANGASIMIQGPTIKRIKISLSIRLNSNVSSLDIETSIKSAVAAAINSSLVGRSIPISEIVSAASMVGGVKAVSVIYPNYSPSSDLIKVNGDEKPIVVDMDKDISVVFTG